jgi:hypothetical protein
MNNVLYKHITDLLFKELDGVNHTISDVLKDREKMIDEYARAHLIENLALLLMKINKDCGDVDDKISEKRLDSMYKMNPPFKELLKQMLVRGLEMPKDYKE